MYCKYLFENFNIFCQLRINSSKVYCKFPKNREVAIRTIVLIVAKCIVNAVDLSLQNLHIPVLIVAKCIVNP